MYKKYFTLLIFFFIVLIEPTFSNNIIDSLEDKLEKADEQLRFEILLKLSNLYYKENPEKAFKTSYRAVEILNPNSEIQKFDLYKHIGVLHHKSSNYDSAVVYYQKAILFCDSNIEIANLYNNTGVLYKEISKYDSAIFYHSKALKLNKTISNSAGVASTQNNIGNVYLKQGNYLMALEYYNSSLETRKELGNENNIAATLLNIGDVYKKQNNYDKALENLTEALALREKSGNKSTIAYTLNAIGNFYLQLKIYDKAREYYSKSLVLREEIGDKTAIASSYSNIGTVHRDLENYDRALEYYQKALEIRKELGNKEVVAISLNNIGGLYWKQKKYGEALDHYLSALEIRLQIGDKIFIASSYKNLGIIYKDMGDYDKALDSYQKAMDVYMQLQDLNALSYIMNLKGNLYKKLGENEKAFSYYENALDTYKQINDLVGIAQISLNLGELYYESKNPDKAIHYFTQAIVRSDQVQLKTVTQDACLALSDIYAQKNNYKKSLQYFKRFTSIKDSIQNDFSKRRIAEIEFEADILLKDTKIQKQALKNKENQIKIADQRTFIFISSGVILIIIIFSVSLFYQFSQKKKAYALLDEKNNLLELANEQLADKNEKITDSITYAKRIQQAILPSEDKIKAVFPESFIFYVPKEIVSGDFFWFDTLGDKVFYAAIDCTGHGVPGAFMSMIGHTLLNEIINEKKVSDLAEILKQLDQGVIKSLKQDDTSTERQEDGMEISLLCFDKSDNTLEFAGANHKLIVVKKNKIETVLGDIFPIGGMVMIKKRKNASFNSHKIAIEKGMTVYMTSDGYVDQFGGAKDERFMSNRFHKLLLDINNESMEEQYTSLSMQFDKWKGNTRQLDDVLVIGIRF